MIKLREGLTDCTSEFWYDLCEGKLKPTLMCENPDDADRILEAISVLQEFEISCEEQIEGFVQ